MAPPRRAPRLLRNAVRNCKFRLTLRQLAGKLRVQAFMRRDSQVA